MLYSVDEKLPRLILEAFKRYPRITAREMAEHLDHWTGHVDQCMVEMAEEGLISSSWVYLHGGVFTLTASGYLMLQSRARGAQS